MHAWGNQGARGHISHLLTIYSSQTNQHWGMAIDTRISQAQNGGAQQLIHPLPPLLTQTGHWRDIISSEACCDSRACMACLWICFPHWHPYGLHPRESCQVCVTISTESLNMDDLAWETSRIPKTHALERKNIPSIISLHSISLPTVLATQMAAVKIKILL